MAAPNVKVELKFDISLIPGVPFVLDDAVKGVLDDPDNPLGAPLFYDVSEFFQSLRINRGKSRELDEYEAADSQVQFDNSRRLFDPKYEISPFFGSIIPRLPIRVTVNDRVVYTGVVRDWNIDYATGNNSVTTAIGTDNFTLLAQIPLTLEFNDIQLSGERIEEVLSRPEVDWPLGDRDIDTGDTLLFEDLIDEGTILLNYLKLIERTELGQLFINKQGQLAFRRRNTPFEVKANFADDGTGIAYQLVSVVYGSELLYNRIQLDGDAIDPVVVDNPISQSAYGISVLTINDLLLELQDDADNMATFLLNEFDEPEYRFEEIAVQLSELSPTDQNTILDLELGDIVDVKFTPSGLPPAIEDYAKIVGIIHDASETFYTVNLKLASLASLPFVLDNEALGVLGTGTLGY
jgi:hypothetical protein